MSQSTAKKVSFMAKEPENQHDWNWILKITNRIQKHLHIHAKEEEPPSNVIPFTPR